MHTSHTSVSQSVDTPLYEQETQFTSVSEDQTCDEDSQSLSCDQPSEAEEQFDAKDLNVDAELCDFNESHDTDENKLIYDTSQVQYDSDDELLGNEQSLFDREVEAKLDIDVKVQGSSRKHAKNTLV